MIPKVLVYPWFGGNPKPDKIKYCIESMHKNLPGWVIEELNEDYLKPQTVDSEFVRDAYNAGKWAFVADFAKTVYLYLNGGVSVDADVEIIKPLDPFLELSFFTGQEINNKLLVTATMGCQASHPIIAMILSYYRIARFTGEPNTQFITKILEALHLQKDCGAYHGKGIIIYPQDYFCPFDHKRKVATPTINTHTIHHFQASWKK